MNIVIDGDVVTHRKTSLGVTRLTWLSVTLCHVWFVEREHPLEVEGIVPKGEPRSRRVDNPIDCMACLVYEARS